MKRKPRYLLFFTTTMIYIFLTGCNAKIDNPEDALSVDIDGNITFKLTEVADNISNVFTIGKDPSHGELDANANTTYKNTNHTSSQELITDIDDFNITLVQTEGTWARPSNSVFEGTLGYTKDASKEDMERYDRGELKDGDSDANGWRLKLTQTTYTYPYKVSIFDPDKLTKNYTHKKILIVDETVKNYYKLDKPYTKTESPVQNTQVHALIINTLPDIKYGELYVGTDNGNKRKVSLAEKVLINEENLYFSPNPGISGNVTFMYSLVVTLNRDLNKREIIDPTPATYTLPIDDQRLVWITNPTVYESGDTSTSDMEFQIHVKKTTNSSTPYTCSINGGTATVNEDYLPEQSYEGIINTNENQTSSSVFVEIIFDGVYENKEKTIVLNCEVNYENKDYYPFGIGTIIDVPPTISISNAKEIESETLNFDINLSHSTTEEIMFEINTNENTAIEDDDYNGVHTTKSIAIGQKGLTLPITTIDNNVPEENDKYFTVNVKVISGATENSETNGTGTIVDNDTLIDGDSDGFYINDVDPTKRDCNDANPAINPGTSEIPGNDIDENCDGIIGASPTDIDDDQDGYTENQGDCNDANPAINPGASEITYDGLDNDCNAATLDDDLDGDNYDHTQDCNDDDPNINPGASEIPYDSVDNDCNTATSDSDVDGDGWPSDVLFVGGDCDDTDASINPQAAEINNDGIDSDCDGQDNFIIDCNDPNNFFYPECQF